MNESLPTAGAVDSAPETRRQAAMVWLRIGFLSFGGPTAQIALMHRVLVEEKRWMREDQFLNALSFCMLLPGPEAMQLATYNGWRLHGVAGGLIAGLSFVIPGALVVLGLSTIYALFGDVPYVEAMFFGVKAAVLIIVVEALIRIARRAMKKHIEWIVAALSFVGIFFLALPFPLIIAAAALFGFFYFRSTVDSTAQSRLAEGHILATVKRVLIWLVIWLLPLAAVAVQFGADHLYSQMGWFFSKLAVVTFGGAYAVLAYMGQDVVQNFGWLSAGQMLDGLGLAETTPGPLILVTEFVGFIAAYGHSGGNWQAGLFGALIALWMTFAPCFLWIFAGAPYIDRINTQPRLKGALAAITAAVVGVIANLALWFGLQVFFTNTAMQTFGPIQFLSPDLASLDVRVILLSGLSAYLLLFRHWSIIWVLTVSALAALLLQIAGGMTL